MSITGILRRCGASVVLRAIGVLLAIAMPTLLGTGDCSAATKHTDSLSHRLSFELRPAYNIISHYTFRNNGDPVNCALSAHARYAFSFSESSHFGKLYPSAYQGVGIAAYTFLHPDITGRPMLVYILQGGRIANLSECLSLNYEWNLGFSWGWQPNDAMSSRCNVMVNLALPIAWRVTPHWELSLTPDFTHFSNGDTHFPNAGTNLFGLRLGVAYIFDGRYDKAAARRYIAPSEELKARSFGDHITYDIILYSGWRGDRFIEGGRLFVIDKPLPIVGIAFQPTYRLNNYFGIGASLDIQADRSLNLYNGVSDESGTTIAYMQPPLWQQVEAGVSLRGEIYAPIFTLGAGFGINLHKCGYDSTRFYTTFSLKAFVTRTLFLHFGYRFDTTQYTHNLMYGLGVRF